jgi:hypothetical protein
MNRRTHQTSIDRAARAAAIMCVGRVPNTTIHPTRSPSFAALGWVETA